jgi:hypothetical protein
MMETPARTGNKSESGDTEARVAMLEHIAVETKDTLKEIKEVMVRFEGHQRSDFRLLLSAGTAVVLALAALMSHGFHWL